MKPTKTDTDLILEYLALSIGYLGSPFDEAKISVKNGNLVVEADIPFVGKVSMTKPKRFTAAWLKKLEAIHISKWKSSYEPHAMVCDGTQWELEYKVMGKRCRHISGSNACPDNWDELIDLIREFTPTFNDCRRRDIAMEIHD